MRREAEIGALRYAPLPTYACCLLTGWTFAFR